ncbi:MAG: pre-peptidase C-terminal domain-containing protein [Pseudomonadota bacterium]
MMTQTFEPSRHDGVDDMFAGDSNGPLEATLFEGADAAAGASTTYTMDVGDTFSGTIGTNTDVDWIKITFEAGKSYTINAIGDGNTSPSGYDTDLRIYTAGGAELAYDDLSGAGFDARITFNPASTGTYYIAVSSYNSVNATGSYDLQVTAAPTPGTAGTIEQMADYLKGGTSGFEYKYNTTSSNQITVDISGLTAAGQKLALWAMDAWEMVADLDFVVQYDGAGNEMITVDDEDSGAFAYFPNAGSTASGVELNVSKTWLSNYGTTIDSYAFQTYIHEFGHALGLNHQGNYNGSANYTTDALFSNDSWQMSAMSYFSQSENTSTNASYAFVTSAMMVDIAAIQDFYGAPGASGATAGNTTFGLGSNLGNYMDDLFAAMASGGTTSSVGNSRTALTIYDQGGTDTLNLSYLRASEGAALNLNGGTFSNIGNEIGVLGIAQGTMIENLVLGAGNDTVTGNGAANTIQTGTGNDAVFGGAGADSISGGSGNDTIEGESAFDLIEGNDGNDSLVGGTGEDTVNGGAGADTLYGNTGLDTISGGAGNDYISTGESADLATGGTGADEMIGRTGNDTLYGNDGNDTLYGSEGADLLLGGNERDFLSGGSGEDSLYGNTGNDSLYGNLGSDYLSGGDGHDLLRGATGNDLLRGGHGDDDMFGNQGRDTLEGGAGNDTLTGGSLTDRFVFYDNHGADQITDFETKFDRLHLGSDLVGGETDVAVVLALYGSDTSGTAQFDFGGGDTIVLWGISTLEEIEANIFIV